MESLKTLSLYLVGLADLPLIALQPWALASQQMTTHRHWVYQISVLLINMWLLNVNSRSKNIKKLFFVFFFIIL